jgi:hypothetical protein
MKRFGIAAIVGTVIFGGIYGLAASLGVSSGTLGAGNAAVAACQSTTLTPSYATAYDSTLPGYKVGVVTVNGLDTTAGKCASKSFKITLVNTSNASLGEVTGTTPASGTSFTADFTSAAVSAANVTGVHVLITG